MYADDFSNPASGWPVVDNGDVRVEYINGEYRILVRPTQYGALVRPGFQPADYSVSASLRNPNGVDGSYWIIFGIASDWSTFYTLEIYPDGWYGIYRYNPSNVTPLAEAFSPAIYQGTATNQIKVVRNGASINAYANGQLLASVIDSNYMGYRRADEGTGTLRGAGAVVGGSCAAAGAGSARNASRRDGSPACRDGLQRRSVARMGQSGPRPNLRACATARVPAR